MEECSLEDQVRTAFKEIQQAVSNGIGDDGIEIDLVDVYAPLIQLQQAYPKAVFDKAVKQITAEENLGNILYTYPAR